MEVPQLYQFIAIDAKGRITSASTANISTSFTLSDGSNTQTVAGGDTLTVAGTSNEVDVAVSATDTVTIGLPNNITVSNNLTVSGNLVVSGTTTQTGSVSQTTTLQVLPMQTQATLLTLVSMVSL